MAQANTTTTRKSAKKAPEKQLKSVYFRTPEELATFVNENKVKPYAITAFQQFQAVYFFD